jgi:sodium transport system permease protein
MKRAWWIVFRKEAVDNLRDRRALTSALLGPVLSLGLAVGLLGALASALAKKAEGPLDLPVVGAEHAPNLIAFLRQNDVNVLPAPADPEAAVRAGGHDAVLIIPADFREGFRAGRAARVEVLTDDSKLFAGASARRARALVEAYGRQIGALRLVARGVSPEIQAAIGVDERDLSTPQARLFRLLGMVPAFVIFAVFLGGMYIAIDTTTGERERGTLESLLLNPVSRTQVVAGKLLATMAFSTLALAETGVTLALLPRLMPPSLFGVRLDFDPRAVVVAFAVALPLTLLFSAAQMVVASFTRSFKEAQTYLSYLVLIPFIPSTVVTVFPVKLQAWMMVIPTFSETMLITRLLRGEPVEPPHVALAACTTLLMGAVLAWVVTRLYRSERLVFSA